MSVDRALIPITFSLAAAAYHGGDVLADTQEVAGAFRVGGTCGVIDSLVLLDKDDQTAAAMTVVFLSAAKSLGDENSAPNISDANADSIVGTVAIAQADWVDLGGAKVATKTNIGLVVNGGAATSLYVGLICAGTPTQTAAGITAKIGIQRD